MKFNIFNSKIEINISKNKKQNQMNKVQKIFTEHFTKRYFFFVLILLISLILSLYIENRNEYKLGDIAKYDIVSNKNIEYPINLLNDEIKTQIKNRTTVEYDKNNDIGKTEVNNLNDLLIELQTIDAENVQDLLQLIAKYKLNIKREEIKEIIKKNDFKYSLYLINILEKIYAEGILVKSDLNKVLANKNILITKSEKNLLLNFIQPNLTLNEEKTQKRIEQNIEKLKNNTRKIKIGDIVVKKGEQITDTNIQDLQNLGMITLRDKLINSLTTIVFFLITSILVYNPMKKYLKNTFNSKAYTPSMLLLIGINVLYLILSFKTDIAIYITPFYIIPMLLLILTRDKVFSFVVFIANIVLLITNFKWLLLMTTVTIYMIYKSDKIHNREEILLNYIEMSIYQIILVVPYNIISQYSLNFMVTLILFTIIVGFVSGIITIGILPYIENTFKILTDIKLVELSDFSSPLLKKLLVIAPGTFHHSLMVGALAERGAEAVNCNSIFARVASYYHDIGKIKRPKYFVENQFEHINPHDKISASLSANIITSHVKDGMIIGRQYGLPEEMINVIAEHHGTTMVKYFYYKALENGEKVDLETFMYPGPKPQTKESAIIMLADSIEAAVRVQKDKRKEVIEELVRFLINAKIEEKQLTEVDLTHRDIEKVIQAFLEVLQGAYHERIEYPKFQKEEEINE